MLTPQRSRRSKRLEIDSLDSLRAALDRGDSLVGYVLQGIDLTDEPRISDVPLDDVLLLGCTLSDGQQTAVRARGAEIMPSLGRLPYNPYRHALYSADELMQGFDADGYTGTVDFKTYEHFDRHRRNSGGTSVRETLAQRIHDHAIDDALEDFLAGFGTTRVVGIMGGHSTSRTDPVFREVARLTWQLTRDGFVVASGGGPGVMEAANLGAYLACFADIGVIDAALAPLASAPRFNGGQTEGTPAYLDAIQKYVASARDVVQRVASGGFAAFEQDKDGPGVSIAIPTWFYGHEPSNLFTSHIAKYFANSIREDGLLAISHGGIIFAPGSAGTWQEIFMDLAHNHYATFGWRSPMVFLGEPVWRSVFSMIQAFVQERGAAESYGQLIALVDSAEAAAAFVAANPPIPAESSPPLYDLI